MVESANQSDALIDCRNPLSIQVCFNTWAEAKRRLPNLVVIPYQFRSVSISKRNKKLHSQLGVS